MADQETNESPEEVPQEEAPQEEAPATEEKVKDNETTDALEEATGGGGGGGYVQRQIGLLGILLIINGGASAAQAVLAGYWGGLGQPVCYILTGIALLWIEVADKGDYLLVTSGPCRWFLCGWGKEKVQYSEIRDYEVVKSCWYTIPEMGMCTGVRILNQCSFLQLSCCGPAGTLKGGCCGHKTVRLTIDDRMFGHNAADDDTDCCLENCCLKNCFGAKCAGECAGGVCGEGCIFSKCFNPCGANCCSMNTMYISTNDAEGLIALLDSKSTKKGKTVTI